MNKFFLTFLFLILIFTSIFSCSKKNESEKNINSQIQKENLNDSNKNENDSKSELTEEEKRLSEELAALEKGNENAFYEEFLQEKSDENLLKAKNFTDSNDYLRFSEIEKEILSSKKTSEGYEIVTANEDRIVRNIFDDEYRLFRKEEWKISGSNLSERIFYEEFDYGDEENSVHSRIAKSKTTISENQKEEIFFDEKGFETQSNKFIKNEENWFLTEKKQTFYDENYKITQIQTEIRKYSDFKNPAIIQSEKYVYNHHDESGDEEKIPSDVYYYKNGKIDTEIIYSSQKDYVRRLYLEDGRKITAYYQDNKKVREVFEQNSNVLRERKYE